MPSKKVVATQLMHSITISGLGCKAFHEGVQNILLWDTRLSRQYEGKVWKSWTPSFYKGHTSVEISNRILTPTFLCSNAQSLPVPYELGKVVKNLVDEGSYKFIEENVISLYEHMVSAKSNR